MTRNTGHELTCGVAQIWRDGRSLHVRGWVRTDGAPIEVLHAETGGGRIALEIETAAAPASEVHFSLFVEDQLQAGITLHATDAQNNSMSGLLDLRMPPLPEPDPEAGELAASAAALQRFADEINAKRLAVLELGSRQLGATPSIWRRVFHGASHYTGFDIHAGPGVDVVGDAHRLSAHVGKGVTDAIFSVAVLEHLAMPWIVAREMNRTLRPDGIVHVTTHQSWPVHETPNDFWRFSDASLSLLFGPMNGFETLACAMNGRLSLRHHRPNPVYYDLPFGIAYSTVYVLARKVADVDSLPAEPGARELDELSRLYPPPTNLT